MVPRIACHSFIMMFEADLPFIDALRYRPLANAMLVLVFLHLDHHPDLAFFTVGQTGARFHQLCTSIPSNQGVVRTSARVVLLMVKLDNCPSLLKMTSRFATSSAVSPGSSSIHLDFFGPILPIIVILFFFVCFYVSQPWFLDVFVDGRHGVPCIPSIALASNLCPFGSAVTALVLTTPSMPQWIQSTLRIFTLLLPC